MSKRFKMRSQSQTSAKEDQSSVREKANSVSFPVKNSEGEDQDQSNEGGEGGIGAGNDVGGNGGEGGAGAGNDVVENGGEGGIGAGNDVVGNGGEGGVDAGNDVVGNGGEGGVGAGIDVGGNGGDGRPSLDKYLGLAIARTSEAKKRKSTLSWLNIGKELLASLSEQLKEGIESHNEHIDEEIADLQAGIAKSKLAKKTANSSIMFNSYLYAPEGTLVTCYIRVSSLTTWDALGGSDVPNNNQPTKKIAYLNQAGLFPTNSEPAPYSSFFWIDLSKNSGTSSTYDHKPINELLTHLAQWTKDPTVLDNTVLVSSSPSILQEIGTALIKYFEVKRRVELHHSIGISKDDKFHLPYWLFPAADLLLNNLMNGITDRYEVFDDDLLPNPVDTELLLYKAWKEGVNYQTVCEDVKKFGEELKKVEIYPWSKKREIPKIE